MSVFKKIFFVLFWTGRFLLAIGIAFVAFLFGFLLKEFVGDPDLANFIASGRYGIDLFGEVLPKALAAVSVALLVMGFYDGWNRKSDGVNLVAGILFIIAAWFLWNYKMATLAFIGDALPYDWEVPFIAGLLAIGFIPLAYAVYKLAVDRDYPAKPGKYQKRWGNGAATAAPTDPRAVHADTQH